MERNGMDGRYSESVQQYLRETYFTTCSIGTSSYRNGNVSVDTHAPFLFGAIASAWLAKAGKGACRTGKRPEQLPRRRFVSNHGE